MFSIFLRRLHKQQGPKITSQTRLTCSSMGMLVPKSAGSGPWIILTQSFTAHCTQKNDCVELSFDETDHFLEDEKHKSVTTIGLRYREILETFPWLLLDFHNFVHNMWCQQDSATRLALRWTSSTK